MISQVLLFDNVKMITMKNKQEIQRKVEETLNSLDGVQRAMANPFLFTHIKQKLDNDEKSLWIGVFSFINKPAVAISAIVITILINAFVFFEFRFETAETTEESEQVFASEYNLSSSTIYDATIDQQ